MEGEEGKRTNVHVITIRGKGGKMCVVERMNVRRIRGRGSEGRNKMW